YDGFNQLTYYKRGALNATKDDVPSPNRWQQWTLDVQGNWTSVSTFDGTVTNLQTRGHNAQNQISQFNGSPGSWYDNNGNQTTDQTGKTLVYDAWDRLVQVKQGTTVLASYKYDALNRRICETVGSTGRTHQIFSTFATPVMVSARNTGSRAAFLRLRA